MNLSRVNFFLNILLLIGIVALFLQTLKLTQANDFASRRIDELEKKPGTKESIVYPATGEPGQNIDALTNYIDQTVATLSGKAKVTATPIPTFTPKSQTKSSVAYVPVYGGSFQTTSSDWTDVPVSGFQLNASDFGTSSYMNWEAVAWVIGGSGEVGIRILDTARGVVVPGSEVYLSAASPSLVSSGRLTFLNGNSTFRVQIKSQTTSTVEFDFGRIKIVY